MTIPSNQSLTATQNEKIIDSLKYEIAYLKSQVKKKNDRIATLDVMLNQMMDTHVAEVRAYEDLYLLPRHEWESPKVFDTIF